MRAPRGLRVAGPGWLAAVAMFMPPAAVAADGSEPAPAYAAAEEMLIEVPHESGYVDLEFQVAPGQVATVSTTELAPPRLVIATLQPGNPDPFVDSPSRVFRMARTPRGFQRLLHVEAEAAGPGVDLYVGVDGDGDALPDASEVTCVIRDVTSADACVRELSGYETWVMLHRRAGAASESRLRWFFLFYGYVLGNDAGEFSEDIAAVSAPGRADDEGRFPVRFSYIDSGMGDGDVRLARIRVVAGAATIERTLRVVRRGSQTRQVSPGWQRTIRLEPGQAHHRIPFPVARGSRSVGFYMEVVGQGNVGYWIRPTADEWSGPVLPPAPDLGLPGAHAATPVPGQWGRRSIRFEGELPALWHATPVNYGTTPISVRISAGASHDEDNPPTLRWGSYYNPERSGHGLFVYRSGTTPVMLWYTYDEAGDPTWYYVQGNRSAGATLVYRAAWVGNRQRLYPVGRLALVPGTDGSVLLNYEIDGLTGFETLQPFLSGCPRVDGEPLDASGHWFDPQRAGTGYSVQVSPDYEFIAAFIYDELGRPRFLVAERGGPFDAENDTLVLDQLQGFPLLGEHQPPVRTAVGLLRRRYADGGLAEVSISADFQGTVPGAWESLDQVRPLGDMQGCVP